jgi:hypothetical protein
VTDHSLEATPPSEEIRNAEAILRMPFRAGNLGDLYFLPESVARVLELLASARARAQTLESADRLWRELLWLRHGCPRHMLYGDDGEMQCNHCMADFKRMPPEKVREIWERGTPTGIARAALSPQRRDETPA